jgi:pimeloyl-ACP methyl ester carboxylesterase
VVVYDRAGLGWSDPGRWPTARRMAEDLHRLVVAASIPPPYVLVGHSLGGLLMRLYAALHPEQVAGLVLVDSSHPDQQRQLRASSAGWRFSRSQWWLRTAKSAVRPLGLARLRADLRARDGHGVDIPPHLRRGLSPRVAEGAVALRRSSRQRRAAVGEMLTFPSLAAAVGRAADGTPGSLGQLPLVVITRGPDTADLWPPTAEATWQQLQADLALLSKCSIHLHAESGDHFVHRAHPDLVVSAIVDLLASLREAAS